MVEIKKSLHLRIEEIQDEAFLKAIQLMITSLTDNEIVGHVGKTPLTKADLLKNEMEADEDIKAGRVYTVDEMRKHFGLKK